MSTPVTGIFILAAAACFFLFWPRYLYPALIISIPFSATAVINFNLASAAYGETAKSLMAWQLFAVLWVLHEVISGVPPWRRIGWFLTRRSRNWLLIFLASLFASLTVPLILNGTAWVHSWVTYPGYLGPSTIPLALTSHNLTQSAILVFGVLFTIFVAAENCSPARVLYTLKLYVGSCLFVASWGLFQFWCQLRGRAYPAGIFNTSENVVALGYKQVYEAGNVIVGRISSATLEPGVLAMEVLVALLVLVVCLEVKRAILPRGWNWLAIVVISAVLLLSTSTTAYFGLFAVVALTGLVLARAGSGRWKHQLFVAVGFLTAGALMLIYVPLVNQILEAAIFLKYLNGSGATRIESVWIAGKEFLRFPILGVGWGTVNSWDLVIFILSNLGIIGMLAFMGFLLPALRRLWSLVGRGDLLAAVLFPVLVLVVILAEGDGFTCGLAYDWFVFGLAAGATCAARPMFPPEKPKWDGVVFSSV